MKKVLILIGTFLIVFIQFVFSQNMLENKYDVNQYILDLEISNSSTEISGNVSIIATVTAPSIDTFAIDLINNISTQTFMIVDSVFLNGVSNTFQHNNNLITIPIAINIPEGQIFTTQIYYHGNGHATAATYDNGIFSTTYSGSNSTYSSCELYGSKIWFPSKQILTDKADSVTFYITTDTVNKTGSNGLLISRTMLPNGKCKDKWVSHYPIAYYLISFVVGSNYEEILSYTQLPNSTDSILMQNLLIHNSPYYPIHIKALEKTDELMNLYDNKLGVYPFKEEKYGVCVIGNEYDGMEHQTMSTMGYLSVDTTMTDLGILNCWITAHEFAHHWFGNYVTCASWNDVWLNEGIATYIEYVALQNIETQYRADLWMNKYHSFIKTAPSGSVYIPNSELTPNRIFDARLSYGKGAAVTHMLRYEINNDSVFFSSLRNFLSEHAYANATTEDFKQSVETTTSNDYTDFFNQWIYGNGYPIFNVNWEHNNDTLTITSIQTSSTSLTTLFKTHFDIKINFLVGDTIIRLFQDLNHETYKFNFSKIVTSIEFDPNNWLIQNNSIITEIESINNSISFNIFPNPANEKITVTIKQRNKLKNPIISIFDINGQLLIQQCISQEKTEIDLCGLAKGIYIIKLFGNDQPETTRFVKN